MPPAALRPRWFLKEPLPDSSARVFLLPYSGCGASMYRQWPTEYHGVNFVPVQLPGRENRLREQPFRTYQELGAALSKVLRPYLDRPYALFGHCSGALAAYETALQAVHSGAPAPERIFVSSEVAPQDGPYGRHLQMTDEELADELRTLIVELGGTPVPTFVDMTLEILRGDIEVNRRYHLPAPPRLPCPITAVGWSGDIGMEPERMTGWSACGDTEQVVLDGGHYAFIEGPEKLLRVLADGVNSSTPSIRESAGRNGEPC